MPAEKSGQWEKLVRRMEQLLRLKSFPVAFKMLADKEELSSIPYLRRPEHKVSLCQLISLVRSFDWSVGADLDDFLFAACPSILGLRELPEYHRDGTFRSIVWVATKKDGQRYEQAIPRLPVDQYQAVAMAPLVYEPFEPDIVLIYGNPAQMMMLINALQFQDYQVMQFFCVGESSCSDAIARCYLDHKPSLSIPCYGERRYGHAQDDEMVMALPAGLMAKALAGLEALYRRGVRYPISFSGVEGDITAALPVSYTRLEEMLSKVRGMPHGVVVGLTGSIASGKSTVARRLVELGAHLIDFDLIARQVVEPGQPAYQEIVDYFGKQVLDDQGGLDRKKMSAIVFSDLEKRKKLEGFTHPRIYEEFFAQLQAITAKDPQGVVMVDVPLLVELNLMYLFEKNVVVYVTPEVQVERLMARDGISQDEAEQIMANQLGMDQKKGFADMVINNDGTPEQTEEQILALWDELKALAMAD
ncbi:MAG: dephospho-CoA kinase [Desulfarculaceae bacterium]|nr:dephospho-CoA kinase [Desulfarculaceae bacterium]MCF8070813.1 dephospho-CoA kinase [Desulfarculaceae bacterium]MCF8102250.1 dephospho-CoA kinase [Desulfarculaceae bacterium]MCF8117688.1 dephospho-CoA kinase [Desulfarculaceae bacterium]